MEKLLIILAVFIIFIGTICIIAFFTKDMDEENLGMVIHKTTGVKYKYLHKCKIKYEGKWMEGAIYINPETCEVFVREMNDFIKNFDVCKKKIK